MGREIRRVPVGFDWPLNKPWQGFIPPAWRPCPNEAMRLCVNGSTPASAWLGVIVHHLMILGDDARRGRLHPWCAALALAPNAQPGPDMTALTVGLAGREPSFLGHDACDQWSAQKKIVEAAGLDPNAWGTCTVCKGHAIHPDDYAASEAWEGEAPPAGEGWQIWETVSEGSPITPAFASPEELADWCVREEPWSTRMDRAAWLRFIAAGWAPSMIGNGSELVEGVVAVGRER